MKIAVNIFGTSCSKQWLILIYFKVNSKRRRRERAEENNFAPIKSHVGEPWSYCNLRLRKDSGGRLTRLRVNPWLLLYVYVLPTGYSKIELVPVSQLHVQRELVLQCQALFGPVLVRITLWICVAKPRKKESLQGFGSSAVPKKSCGSTHRANGGRFQFLLFSLNVEYKKKIITCDFVDFALVDYLSVHAYHHFYM